jgi:hypothetical protein
MQARYKAMFARTIDKTLSTSAVACKTAHWAIESAAENPNGSYYALITARVFTAFIFEGVINHLGETLCPTWNELRSREVRCWIARCRAFLRRAVGCMEDKKPPLAREPLAEKHKIIRRLLKLDNGGREYQEIQPSVHRAFKFRDGFAHPKLLQETVEDSVQSPDFAPMPAIAWESEIDASLIESDYKQLETYCTSLLHAAADLLESTASRKEYPHLADLEFEAAQLRRFLHSSSMSTYTCSV